jgi:hypothetical protein
MEEEYHRPTKMTDLPEYTQDFLIDLREEEIEELQEAIKFMRSVKTVSTFFKWFIITSVGIFVGAVSFGESIGKMRGWFK